MQPWKCVYCNFWRNQQPWLVLWSLWSLKVGISVHVLEVQFLSVLWCVLFSGFIWLKILSEQHHQTHSPSTTSLWCSLPDWYSTGRPQQCKVPLSTEPTQQNTAEQMAIQGLLTCSVYRNRRLWIYWQCLLQQKTDFFFILCCALDSRSIHSHYVWTFGLAHCMWTMLAGRFCSWMLIKHIFWVLCVCSQASHFR